MSSNYLFSKTIYKFDSNASANVPIVPFMTALKNMFQLNGITEIFIYVIPSLVNHLQMNE